MTTKELEKKYKEYEAIVAKYKLQFVQLKAKRKATSKHKEKRELKKQMKELKIKIKENFVAKQHYYKQYKLSKVANQ